MERLMALIAVTLGFSIHAKAEQFGFWNGSDIKYDAQKHSGYVFDNSPGSFHFAVEMPQVQHFLECATGPGADDTVYLIGEEENGGPVVTQAYLCIGDINLGNCSKKQMSCPTQSASQIEVKTFCQAIDKAMEDEQFDGAINMHSCLRSKMSIEQTAQGRQISGVMVMNFPNHHQTTSCRARLDTRGEILTQTISCD